MKALIFAAVIIGVCALLLWAITGSEKAAKNKKPNDNKFDERQIAARGKASGHALAAVCVYLFLDSTVMSNGAWAAPGVDAYLGLFLGAGVFAVECIRHDAYFAIGQNAKSYLTVCAVCGVAQWIVAIRHLRAGDVLVDGLVSENMMSLVLAVWWLAIWAAVVLRLLRAKREDAEDTDE